MASEARLRGAVRLARTLVDSDHAPFMARELAWAVLQLARERGARPGGSAGAREGAGGEDPREGLSHSRHPSP